MDKNEISQIIQYSLTPGIMISSSALFILGLQTRFSNLFSRFRALNQERRSLEQIPQQNAAEKERLRSLSEQISRILTRTSAVKNAILCFFSAIICFVICVLGLFASWWGGIVFAKAGLVVFFTGMLLILSACIFMLREISLSYHILRLERAS